jgi:hypothetical protein
MDAAAIQPDIIVRHLAVIIGRFITDIELVQDRFMFIHEAE